MHASFRLLPTRRFLPLFVTQFLGAFNDNLFKTAMVLLITFRIYSDPAQEAAFNAIAGALFILPFFLFSAIAGQLADSHDKARIIRIVKTAEVAIMLLGAVGLLLPSVHLLLACLFAMGVHSAFFGPVKYSILPQHLDEDELLGGTGLVEAGTYAAILIGTILGGIIPPIAAAALVIAVAMIGRLTAQMVPPALPEAEPIPVDRHIIRASVKLVRQAMHVRRLFLAILSISFFWGVGTVLASQFPPLVKNGLGGDEGVATMFLTLFSLGIALGSILINRLLQGHVSARWAPASALLMGAFVLDLYFNVHGWPHLGGPALHTWRAFMHLSGGWRVMLDITGVAVAGGMFVVPLYTFLQTTVAISETSRTIAANNIVNSIFMVGAALMATAMAVVGFSVTEVLLLVVAGTIGAALLAWRLHLACD